MVGLFNLEKLAGILKLVTSFNQRVKGHFNFLTERIINEVR